MPNPYEPDFEFPYNEGTPATGPSSNSPINLNLGQVPEVDDPILAQILLDIYNALEVLQTFQGNLTSATGAQIANLAALTARVTSAEASIAANANAILTKQSIEYESITVTADYTITLTSRLIRVDCTGGGVVVTLPLASTFEGRRYTIKRIDTSDNTVTLVPTSSELIDGHCTSITIPSKAAIEVQAGVDYWDTISKR